MKFDILHLSSTNIFHIAIPKGFYYPVKIIMDVSKKYDLVIIGAGGLLLSILLGRKGLRIALLEKNREMTTPLRGELIQPGGLKILEGIGLLGRLLALDSHQNQSVHFYQAEGDKLCTMDYQRLLPPYNYSLILLPKIIQDLFLKEATALPNVEMIRGATFQSVSKGAITYAQDGAQKEIYAPIVVGADGAFSPLRKALSIPYDLHHYQDGYLTALLPRPENFDDALYYLGKGKILGLFPISKQALYLFYMVQKDQITALRATPISVFKQQLCHIHKALETPLQNLTRWEETDFSPCLRVRCSRWVSDGAVLMGDAAHAMNPHVAQGRNAAMEDAVVLSNVLLDCFQKGDFSQKVLSEYEAVRRPSVTILQQLGDEMTFFWNSGFTPIVWARNQSFKALHTNKKLHDKMVRMIAGLQISPMTLWDRVQMTNLLR
jgi:2-polyprenyl-6-methoxyphenol hydroxylase-like FAD-dependent oxidoreductase